MSAVHSLFTRANAQAVEDIKDAQAQNGVPMEVQLQLAVAMNNLAQSLKAEPDTVYAEEFDASVAALAGFNGVRLNLPEQMDILGLTVDNASAGTVIVYQGSVPSGRILTQAASFVFKTINAPTGTKSICVTVASGTASGPIRIIICNKLWTPFIAPSGA